MYWSNVRLILEDTLNKSCHIYYIIHILYTIYVLV